MCQNCLNGNLLSLDVNKTYFHSRQNYKKLKKQKLTMDVLMFFFKFYNFDLKAALAANCQDGPSATNEVVFDTILSP